MKGLVGIQNNPCGWTIPAEQIFSTGVPTGRSASIVFPTRIRYKRLDRSSDIDATDETVPAKGIVRYWYSHEKISISDHMASLYNSPNPILPIIEPISNKPSPSVVVNR